MYVYVCVCGRRWVLRGAKWGSKQAWYYCHIGSQLIGMALFIAGFVVANVKFEDNVSDKVRTAHANLGIAVMAMAGFQVRLRGWRGGGGRRAAAPVVPRAARSAAAVTWSGGAHGKMRTGPPPPALMSN